MRERRAALFVAALILFAVHAALLSGFTSDDAFISYRYARNIAVGFGSVFNPGQQVEGFSNPLFTLVLAGLYRLIPNTDVFPQLARLVGFLSGVGSLIVISRLPAAGGPWTTGLALLLTASSTSFSLWSVGGLETALYGFLIVAAVAVTLSPARGIRGRIGLGLLLAAIALSRPEGVILAAGLSLEGAFDRERRRDLRGHGIVILTMALPVIGYALFRHSYYGEWVPNTWFAKKIEPAFALPRGFAYLWSFIRSNGTAFLYLPGLLVLRSPRTHRVSWACLGVLTLYVPCLLRVGGDWMDAHRFVAPVVPLLSFVVADGWRVLLDALRGAMDRVGAAGAAWWARPAGFALVLGLSLVPNVANTRRERETPYVNATPYYETIGRLIGEISEPDWVVATDDIGAIGWYGRTRVLDLLGLVNSEIAHGRIARQYLIARELPELIVLHYDDRTPPRSRWQPVKVHNCGRLWVATRAPVPIPGSIRVRADVVDRVEARLATLPSSLRADLVALDAYLRAYQPDMKPVTAFHQP